MRESLLSKLKRVSLRDVGHCFLFLLALLPAAVLRLRRPHLWLVCEKGSEARDNGYWFFRYLRQEHPDIDAVYAIAPGGRDFHKVAELGPTVRFGSFRHWVYYLAAEINVSSQKDGKPNAAVCYALEVILGILKNRRVFLQHGVIKDDLPYLHYDQAKMGIFCCGARPEYEYIRDTFGYPPDAVRYTGLCRFDSLHRAVTDENLILILPTWRMDMQRSGDRESFLQSSYYRCWSALIGSAAFNALLRENGKRAVFCMHRNMEAFEDCFPGSTGCISVLRWQDADVETLIRSSAMLITDFSSVFMDFAYMCKPVLYYQFDYESFREHHLPEGYFDYRRDGFGEVCNSEEALLAAFRTLLHSGFTMPEVYAARSGAFYTLHDTKNCERTWSACIDLIEKGKP